MKDKLIESAVTAGSFMIIDKLYYLGWSGNRVDFLLLPLSKFGPDMIAWIKWLYG